MFAECSQAPLESNVVILDVIVGYEIFVFFVYAVVSQVHELVVFVCFCAVKLACKSGKALFVNVNS